MVCLLQYVKSVRIASAQTNFLFRIVLYVGTNTKYLLEVISVIFENEKNQIFSFNLVLGTKIKNNFDQYTLQ